QAMESTLLRIPQHIPELAAEALRCNLHVRLQSGAAMADPVPRVTEERLTHAHHAHRCRRSQSNSVRLQIQTTRRRSTSILATPSIPGRNADDGPLSAASTRNAVRPSCASATGVILSTRRAKG